MQRTVHHTALLPLLASFGQSQGSVRVAPSNNIRALPTIHNSEQAHDNPGLQQMLMQVGKQAGCRLQNLIAGKDSAATVLPSTWPRCKPATQMRS